MSYKKTLLLPQTKFEMRGNLIKKEPFYLKFWEDNQIYQKLLTKNKDQQTFILHDGPPYANGDIHIGHALNKVLKDFVIKSKSILGYYTPFVPGWDTHGLPIEQKIIESGVNIKEITIKEFRQKCLEYATIQLQNQKKQMQRLGIFGFFDKPYITFKKEYETPQIKAFFNMYEKGLIYKDLKPIYWSPSSETALADAEIIYEFKKSKSIYVPFTINQTKGKIQKGDKLLIWTTTPWTLPANSGIAIDQKIKYILVEYQKSRIIIAFELLDELSNLFKHPLPIIETINGEELIGLTYDHPFLDKSGKVVHGFHVELDSGTGLVHMAPAHGPEDFLIGKNNNLEIYNLINDQGHFKKNIKLVGGMFWLKADKIIFEYLKTNNLLLYSEEINHSYPHDWRTKKPVMYRATLQWFCSIDKIKDNILDAIKNVKWISTWGEKRLTNMMVNRSDWCISRQRVWGVPIPIIYGEDNKPILDQKLNKHIVNLFKTYGSNIWFEKDVNDLLPKNYYHKSSPNNKFKKELDTMDVWFDSGSSSLSVSKNYDLPWPFDLYLEGSDQYRGWFNSSIIIGAAVNNQSPYKQVLSHGFVLDGKGEKMSKSKGNVINPLTVANEFGVDILRIWIASCKYQADVRISKDILKQSAEQYRSVRFKIRFALSNLFDYNFSKNYLKNLPLIDQYFIQKINEFNTLAKKSYDQYQFNLLFIEALNLLNNLSTNYFDFVKDILYVQEANCLRRRQVQTVLSYFLHHFLIIMSPIIPFTCEEAFTHFLTKNKPKSIFLQDFPKIVEIKNINYVNQEIDKLLSLKKDILKELEINRIKGVIGKPSQASVVLFLKTKLSDKILKEVQLFLMVSKITFKKTNDFNGQDYPSAFIKVEKHQGRVCDRCWMTFDQSEIKDQLCLKCFKIIKELE